MSDFETMPGGASGAGDDKVQWQPVKLVVV
jgi:hypothetical protein